MLYWGFLLLVFYGLAWLINRLLKHWTAYFLAVVGGLVIIAIAVAIGANLIPPGPAQDQFILPAVWAIIAVPVLLFLLRRKSKKAQTAPPP